MTVICNAYHPRDFSSELGTARGDCSIWYIGALRCRSAGKWIHTRIQAGQYAGSHRERRRPEFVMNYETALKLFAHTLEQEGRVHKSIDAALLQMADSDLIEQASEQVSSALALGERVWMTSDLHFGHSNIIGFCDRPFHNVAAMNSALASLLGKVGESELLVIAGDVLLGDDEQGIEPVRQIPGRKILVVGNHDFKRDGACPLLMERNLMGMGLCLSGWCRSCCGAGRK